MREQDKNNEMRMQKSAEDLHTSVKILPEADIKQPIEGNLILQGVSEDDSKYLIQDETIARHYSRGDVQSVAENEDQKLNRFKYRQCPLTVPRNNDGLVNGHTFWKDSNKHGNCLYDDFSSSESKGQTLTAVFYPAKPRYVARFTRKSDNEASPMSIMAEHLLHQMEENSVTELKSSSTYNNSDNSVMAQEDGLQKSDTSTCSKHGDELDKKFGSRMRLRFTKMFCCNKQNDDE